MKIIQSKNLTEDLFLGHLRLENLLLSDQKENTDLVAVFKKGLIINQNFYHRGMEEVLEETIQILLLHPKNEISHTSPNSFKYLKPEIAKLAYSQWEDTDLIKILKKSLFPDPEDFLTHVIHSAKYQTVFILNKHEGVYQVTKHLKINKTGEIHQINYKECKEYIEALCFYKKLIGQGEITPSQVLKYLL